MSEELQSTETNQAIEKLEAELLKLEQLDIPVTHRFAPGVYMREIVMPKGSFIIGHCHKTKHLNIITEGSVSVMIDGVAERINAPCTFVSEAGIRKILYIHSDTRWATIHPTNETNIEQLEAELIVKSDSFIRNEELRHFGSVIELDSGIFSRAEDGL